MIRTQISLTATQMTRLRDAARRRRVSIAAVVRGAVEDHLDDDPDDWELRKGRARATAGAFRSDLPTPFGSVAENHDA